jgi:hypothetical protein
MNKPYLLPLFIIITVLSLGFATAAPDMTLNTITGNTLQKESYTGTLKISNTGDETLDITSISVSSLTFGSNSMSATLSQTSAEDLLAGQNKDVTVTVSAGSNQAIGTYNGNITVVSTNGVTTLTKTTPVSITVSMGNHLTIDKVTVDVDDQSDTVKDGDKIADEANPSSTITIEIRVENDFDDNMDIEDIEVSLQADNDLDWDEEEEIDKIKDSDKETVTFTLEVPSSEDIDEDTYTIDIRVSGTDEKGNDHDETWTIELEVEKEKYDLDFTNINLNPSSIACDAQNAAASITIENIGSDDIDKGTLVIKSNVLKEDVIIRNMEIDEEDEMTKTLSLALKSNLAPGDYTLNFQLYTTGNSNDDTDFDVRTLTVLSCVNNNKPAEDKEDTEKEDTKIEVIAPTKPNVPTTGNVVQTVTGTPSSKFIDTSSNMYLGLLIAIIVLLLILISIAAASLGRRK